jgi:hypothetical protein
MQPTKTLFKTHATLNSPHRRLQYTLLMLIKKYRFQAAWPPAGKTALIKTLKLNAALHIVVKTISTDSLKGTALNPHDLAWPKALAPAMVIPVPSCAGYQPNSCKRRFQAIMI